MSNGDKSKNGHLVTLDLHESCKKGTILGQFVALKHCFCPPADLSPGEYVARPASACAGLCADNATDAAEGCCVAPAECACGARSGRYACRCPPGHHGDGVRGCRRE